DPGRSVNGFLGRNRALTAVEADPRAEMSTGDNPAAEGIHEPVAIDPPDRVRCVQLAEPRGVTVDVFVTSEVPSQAAGASPGIIESAVGQTVQVVRAEV